MTITDIDIEIKKRDKYNRWILNLVVCDTFEIRGFIWAKSQFPTQTSGGYYLTPPIVKSKNGAKFWVAKCLDKQLWDEIQAKIEKKISEQKISEGELDIEEEVKGWD